jgi:hypothetical protein
MAWRVQGDEPPDAPILCSGEQPVAEIVPNTQPHNFALCFQQLAA